MDPIFYNEKKKINKTLFFLLKSVNPKRKAIADRLYGTVSIGWRVRSGCSGVGRATEHFTQETDERSFPIVCANTPSPVVIPRADTRRRSTCLFGSVSYPALSYICLERRWFFRSPFVRSPVRSLGWLRTFGYFTFNFISSALSRASSARALRKLRADPTERVVSK